MSNDGLPTRAGHGAREADADRRTTATRLAPLAAFSAAALVVIAACGTGASNSPTTSAAASLPSTAAESASTEASASASSGVSQGFITFQEMNASKVFGGGTVTDLGDGSSAVTLGVVAVGYTDPLPARIVAGACTDAASAPPPSFPPPASEAPSAAASAAASAAPSVAASESAGASLPAESVAPTPATLPIDLTPVSGGGSNTVVQIALSDLLASPSSVLVYKSTTEPNLVACSDITATLTIPSGAPSAAASAAASAEMSLEPSASSSP